MVVAFFLCGVLYAQDMTHSTAEAVHQPAGTLYQFALAAPAQAQDLTSCVKGDKASYLGGVSNVRARCDPSAGTPCVDLARLFVRAQAEYLTVLDNATMSLGADTDFTWAEWAYFADTADVRLMFGKGGATTNLSEYYCWVGDTERFDCFLGNGASSASIISGVLAVPGWHFFAFRHDAANNLIRLRADATDSVAVAWAGGTQDTADNFSIGRHSLVGTGYYDGRLSNFGLWKVHLSDAQVTTLAAGVLYEDLPGGFPAPTEWFELAEVSGDATGKVVGVVLTDTNTVGSATGPGICP